MTTEALNRKKSVVDGKHVSSSTTGAIPKTRLGSEIGWTTNYYYSAHGDVRREEWRHQWRMRQNLEDNKEKIYTENRERLLADRERRNRLHEEDMREREDKSKEIYRRHKERQVERSDIRKLVEKEAHLIGEEVLKERESDKNKMRDDCHRFGQIATQQKRATKDRKKELAELLK